MAIQGNNKSKIYSEYNKLFNMANMAMSNSCQIKSGVTVGAALITNEEKIYQGANFETSFHQLGICAERTAIASAIAVGSLSYKNPEKTIKAIVVTSNINNIIYPCGNCLEVISAFSKSDTKIICLHTNTKNYELFEIGEIFPQFDMANIQPNELSQEENENILHFVREVNANIDNAYTYTKEKTASGIVTMSGKKYFGVGMDNIAYGTSRCGEEGAIIMGLTQGEISKDKPIKAVVVSTDFDHISKISGNSLQLISEFADLETTIICANKKEEFRVYKIDQLFPVFGKLNKHLGSALINNS